MNKNVLFAGTMVTSLLVLNTNVEAKKRAVPEKKNVLFLMADDFNYWLNKIGYYPTITPNLDKLATKGVLFTEAHCSSPVCNPSRNALWSGMRPSTTGIESNNGGYVREIPGFANIVSMHQYFMDHGYYTYGGGKLWHAGSMGSESTDPAHWNNLYTEGTGSPGGNFYKFSWDEGGLFQWSAGEFDMNTQAGDTKLANHMAEFIAGYDKSANSDKPFFLGVGLFRPHLPWYCHKQFYDMFDPDKLPIPKGYKAHDLDDIPGAKIDPHQTEIVAKGKWKEALRAYCANMAYADYNAGIVLDALAKSKYAKNTIVCFMGDHGWHLGEKDRWAKYAVYDQANHTTLIIYDPTAKGNGKVCTKVVSLQDLYPTLVALTGLPENPKIEGRNIAPLLTNPTDKNWNWPILMSYSGTNYIKTNTWRFVDDGERSQLYKTSEDPYEWDNLYNKPGYEDIINGLKHQMDSMLLPGTKIRETLLSDPKNTMVAEPHKKIKKRKSDSEE